MSTKTDKKYRYSAKDSIIFEEADVIELEDLKGKEKHFSYRDSITFKEDPDDLRINLDYNNIQNERTKEDELIINHGIKTEKLHENVKIETEYDIIQDERIIHQGIKAEKIHENVKIKAEHSESFVEDSSGPDLENNPSFKDSIVFKEDLDALYENHTVIGEMIIGPQVFQHETSLLSPGNHVNSRRSDFKNNKLQENLTNSPDTLCNLKKIPCDHECNQCGDTFRKKVSLEKHLKARGDSLVAQKRHNCDYCSKVFMWKHNLKRHEKIHFGTKPFKCDKCNKTYQRKENLRNHYLNRHSDSKKETMNCKFCNKVFTDRSNFNRHQRLYCSKNYLKVIKKLKCDVCQKTYKTKSSLIEHIRLHMAPRSKSQGRQVLECDLCSHQFTRKTNLRYHIESQHLKLKNFLCKKCNLRYTRKSSLTRHERKCKGHTQASAQVSFHKSKTIAIKGKFICDLCSNIYKSKVGLICHIEVKHLNIRRFSCKQCTRKFTRKWCLNIHENKCLSHAEVSLLK